MSTEKVDLKASVEDFVKTLNSIVNRMQKIADTIYKEALVHEENEVVVSYEFDATIVKGCQKC